MAHLDHARVRAEDGAGQRARDAPGRGVGDRDGARGGVGHEQPAGAWGGLRCGGGRRERAREEAEGGDAGGEEGGMRMVPAF
ncbi:hypothetical protein MAFF212519_08000 [Clavibacter michiganensis]